VGVAVVVVVVIAAVVAVIACNDNNMSVASVKCACDDNANTAIKLMSLFTGSSNTSVVK